MSKIGVLHLFVNGGYIYIIDDRERIWCRHVPKGEWEIIAELPDDINRGKSENSEVGE